MSNGQDPQNPFRSTVEPAPTGDPQNPFAVEEPSIAELALAGLRGEAELARGLVTFPLEIARGPVDFENLVSLRDEILGRIERRRRQGLPTWATPLEVQELISLHGRIEELRPQAELQARARRGRALAAERRGEPVPTEGKDFRAFLRRIFGVKEVSGVAEPPRTRAEMALGGIFGLPNHLVAAFEDAPTQEEQARALGGAVATAGMFALPAARGKPGVPRVATDIIERSAAARVAQIRQLNSEVTGGWSTELVEVPRGIPSPLIPVRDVPLPIEGELAAIKERLLTEAEGNITSAILATHRRQGPYGTTVISGIERPLSTQLERLADVGIDYYARPDGLLDVAVIGDKSPLAVSEAASRQFAETGFFEGQEVSYNGKTYVVDEFSQLRVLGTEKPAAMLLKGTEGERFVVFLDQVRRLPSTQVDLPIAATVRIEPFTPLDAAELISKTAGILDPLAAATLQGIAAVKFDDWVARFLGQETGEIATVPRGRVVLRPGVNVVAVPERFTNLAGLFDDPLPEVTAYVYADPGGRPVAWMEVDTFFNGGFPGTGKQLIQQVGLPSEAQVAPVFGKAATGITGFMVDPRAPKFLQGRAMVALLERAGELGVTRMYAPVDEAGLRAAARYINKYIGKKKSVEKAYRVTEMEVDWEGVWRDFKVYYDGAASSEKVARRLTGREPELRPGDPGVTSDFDPPVPAANGPPAFGEIVSAFARESGFLPEELPGLQRFLEQRLAKELRETYLTPEELGMYEDAAKYLRERFGGEPRLLEVVEELPELPLSMLASSNNVTAEWRPGWIEVRARDDGSTLLGVFRSEESARGFINKLGQAEGPPLDGAGRFSDLPPGVAPPTPPPGGASSLTGGIPPNLPPDPLSVAWLPPGDRVATAADYYASTLTLVTEYDRVINAYDNRFGTTFSNDVRAITEGLRVLESERHPWLIRLQAVDKLLKTGGRRAPERMRVLTRYAETMTSEEVARTGFFRPLNETERNFGNLLASLRVDLSRVEEFVRKTLDLEESIKDPVELATATKQLAVEFRFDRDHLAAATLVRRIREMDIDQAFLGHVVRYADAKMLEEMGIDTSPAGFARENKITPRELQAMKMLENIGEELAPIFNIPEYRRIRRWLPHYLAYSERGVSPTAAFLGQRGIGRVPEIKFVSELARTGELSTYVTDPVLAMMRYVNAGFRAKHLNTALETAITRWKVELGKVPADVRRGVEQNLARYLSDARGVPEASRNMIARTTAEIAKKFGVEVSGDLGRSIVNSILATYSLKFIAFRMFQGLRDYWSMWGTSFMRLGAERARTMHKLGFGVTEEQIAALHKSGAIPPGMSPIEVEAPAALVTAQTGARRAAAGLVTRAAAKYVDFVSATADIGLKVSLQPQVYTRWHAGAYLEGRARALSAFNDLAFGKVDAAGAFRRLDLEAYSPAFIRQLQDLVNAKKLEEAAHLYGQETGRMIGVTYGRTMHPKGWATLVGRLAGGYGRYPTWLANTLVETLSRGSRAYRVKALARLGIYTAFTLAALEETLGIDAYNWLLLPAVRWFGGPATSLAKAVLDLSSPNDAVRNRATAEIERQLSPIPLAARDATAALGLFDENAPRPTNPLEVVARLSGARLAEEPSVLDQLLGTR